jgi:PTH2 family peptidyl-tRNA hydrolase
MTDYEHCENIEYSIIFHKNSILDNWLNGIFTKICVSVDSEQELLNIYETAKAKNMFCSIIEDNGLTEFNDKKTFTCCAILGFNEDVDKITGHLKLL